MNPALLAFTVITCARYAVVALTVFAAWRLESGIFLFVALLIALLGGYGYTNDDPTVCPKCGHVIAPDNPKSID